MPLVSQAFLVCLDQLSGIDEILDIVPLVPLGAILCPLYKVLNGQAFTFSYYAFIKKAINFKRFIFLNVIIHKYQKGLLQMGAVEWIFEWVRSRLKLSHRENKIDFPIIQYFEFVGQTTYLLNNLEKADVLLDYFFCYTNRR